MDVASDAGHLLGLGREAILDEPLSWLLHLIHRENIREAARAKIQARTQLLAAQATMGGGDAHRALGDFFGEMDAIIHRNVFASPADREVALHSAASATFDRIAALAR